MVYDLLGRPVADLTRMLFSAESAQAGEREIPVSIPGSIFPRSGIYILLFRDGAASETRMMTYLR